MSLSDLASLGSFVSGLAVLASLLFLGLQWRQTNRNQHSLMHLGRTQILIDYFTTMSNEKTIDAVIRGSRGDLNMSGSEFFRFRNSTWIPLIAYENNFLQHRFGTLNDAQFEATLGTLRWNCMMPGFRALWAVGRPLFDSHFAGFIGDLMTKSPCLLDPEEFAFDDWKREVRQQLETARPTL